MKIAIFWEIMGKTQSKNEEIIIAQNGANNANPRLTDVEAKLSAMSIIDMILIGSVILIFLYIAYQHHRRHMRKMIKKDLTLSGVSTVGQAFNANQQV